jgi:hypothetical protein
MRSSRPPDVARRLSRDGSLGHVGAPSDANITVEDHEVVVSVSGTRVGGRPTEAVSLDRMSPGRHAQDQEAGANSEQQQAARDIINITHVGISAADVIAITQSETKRIIEEELTPAAERIAEQRLDQFGQKMIERFAENPQLRKAFADPDFQYSLHDASRAAASNDDDHTEDLLVDLLANRAEEGNSARLRLITSRAIQAADKLSSEALRGLTASWALLALGPSEPSAVGYITVCSAVAATVIQMGIEADHGWIEELEALGLARASSGLTLRRKPYKQLLGERAAAHLNGGIDQETHRDLIESAIAGCPELRRLLGPHQLKPGFVVLAGTTADEFRNLVPVDAQPSPQIEQLIGLNGFGGQDAVAVASFNERVDEAAPLVEIGAWWDALPMFDPTLVGRAIGLVNARRHIAFRGVQTIAEMLGESAPPAAL